MGAAAVGGSTSSSRKQHARDLDDEERVPAGVLCHAERVGAAEVAGLHGELHGVLGRERLHPERDGVGEPARPAGPLVQEPPARDADHEQRQPPAVSHQPLDQVEQQRFGRVQVLEHEHHRPGPGQALEHGEHATTDLGAVVAVLVVRVLSQAERQTQAVRDLAGGLRADPLDRRQTEPVGELLGGDVRAALDGVADHLSERPERDLFLELAGAPAQDRDLLAQPVPELLDHARLADPRLAQQRDQVGTAALLHAFERVGQQRELAAAIDERDRGSCRSRRQPDHRPRGDLVVELLRADHAHVTELDGILHKLARGRPHQDLAWLGRLLQPRADVHLTADHDASVGGGPDGDQARVDAHVHLHGGRQPELEPQLRCPVHHGQRGADGPHGVVVVRRRHAEHRQDRVADERFRPAPEPLDLLGHHPVERREHLAEPFGIEVRSQLRRSHQIDEHHGDQPPFRSRLDRDRSAAVGTELGARRQRFIASGTRRVAHTARIRRPGGRDALRTYAWPRILAFCAWNSSSVSTPLARRSARRSSSVTVDGAIGTPVGGGGAAIVPAGRNIRCWFISPWW